MGSIAERNNDRAEWKLLVTAIEDKARWTPNNTFMRYPPKDWEEVGYEAITWAQYIRGIDKVAYWLDGELGKASELETIGYFGPNDPRYAFIVPAAIKTSRKVLIPDGRVTESGLRDLVHSTECKVWIYTEDDTKGPLLKDAPDLTYCALPSVEWILDYSTSQPNYPYTKTFEEGAHDVIAIIHTSSTTGVPRPIYHTNGLWSAMGSGLLLSKRHWPRGIAHETWMGRNGLNCCAPQWLAGLAFMMISPTFQDSPCIMLPPEAVGLTADLFKTLLRMNQIDGLKCPPHTVKTLYEDSTSKELIKKLKYVLFLGAALERSIGDDLSQYTRLSPLIGSTETGDQMSLRPATRALWYTHDFVPETGSRMVPINSGDDAAGELHELIIERYGNGADSWFQPAFWNPEHRNLNRIETKEIYAPIKDADGRTRWIFSARKDDLTKLNWLAKFHAQDIEDRILRHKAIETVVVGGEGRPTPYVIVEVKAGMLDSQDEGALLDELYASTITNKADIDEIRIPRETVMVATSDKPFKRNAKQVILRKEVEKDYHQEIEDAYRRLENRKVQAVS